MSVPHSRTNATVAQAGLVRSLKGLSALTVAGSLSITLAAVAPAAAAARHEYSTAAVTHSLSTQPDGTNARRCRPRKFLRFHYVRPRNFFIPRTRFIDGPGGTITASVTRSHRVYAEVEFEREKRKSRTRSRQRTNSRTTTPPPPPEGEATITRTTSRALTRQILRELRFMVNPLLAEEHIVEVGHTYTREISPGMYGNLWYRVFGYRVGFSAWRVIGNCRVRPVGTGIANIPARVEGWRYWETKHPTFRGRKLSER